MSELDRRGLLLATVATGGAVVLGPPAGAAQAGPARSGGSRRLRPEVFALGVASGDPSADGVVLWTRLAPSPLDESGHAGMPARDVAVDWEVASDARFTRVVRRGRTTARYASAHSVHVELAGLRAGTEYFYRFRAAGQLSPTGRTRTAPAPGSFGTPLAMAVGSCAHFEEGWFTGFRAMAADEPDLVAFLGDYLYEYPTGHSRVPTVREYAGPPEGAHDLASYRLRHAQHRTDPDLRAAHAVAPWLLVFDDHEVENNWAGEHPGRADESREVFLARRAAAFRAYYEHLPLRAGSLAGLATGGRFRLHRRIRWGRLANLHLLDTRQFRDDQACGDGTRTDCAEATDPGRSLLGAAQERWLLEGFGRPTDSGRPTWEILAQQVFFAQRDADVRPDHHRTSMDSWDGYTASRDRITRGWVERKVRNPVVLTGDVHRHWVADLKTNYDDPDSAVVGAELVSSSLTSSGDGDEGQQAADYLRHNPHIRYYRNRRGYLRTRISPQELRAEVRVTERVTDPNATYRTDRTFVVTEGVPGVRPG